MKAGAACSKAICVDAEHVQVGWNLTDVLRNVVGWKGRNGRIDTALATRGERVLGPEACGDLGELCVGSRRLLVRARNLAAEIEAAAVGIKVGVRTYVIEEQRCRGRA